MTIDYRSKEGIYYPVVVCDSCMQPIREAKNGIVILEAIDEFGVAFTPKFRHKNRDCDPKYGRTYPWFDLSEFLYQLVSNTKVDLEKAEQRHEQRIEVGLTV